MPIQILPAENFVVRRESAINDPGTIATCEQIVSDVRAGGEPAIRKYAEQFGERTADQPLVFGADQMQRAAERIDPEDLALLQRVAARIKTFATAQMECLRTLTTKIPGGTAGHTIEPIQRAGCYAPAGRYPLPSTVLMTVVTARTAGCESVVLATPGASDLMLAAAAVGGADEVLAIGGAHAISAMAYGFKDFAPCDLIVGPGNRWVTAAKKIVSGDCGIDMLAGPSELVLLADESADPQTVAADLLGQAEHDTDARAFLVTISRAIAESTTEQLLRQLEDLPTAETARTALQNGAIIVCNDMPQAIETCNRLAPEHLEIHCELNRADEIAAQLKHAGCIFIGHRSAEVFGDYGVGPNHTLPTGGTARFSAGLNVFTFLRIRTWLRMDNVPDEIIEDTARLAALEGLEGHRRSSLRRKDLPAN